MVYHGLNDIVMEDIDKKDKRNPAENCQTTRSLVFCLCHTSLSWITGTKYLQGRVQIQCEKKCKLSQSLLCHKQCNLRQHFLSSLIAQPPRSAVALSCHCHFCLALRAMPLALALIVSILCYPLMICHIQLSCSPQLNFTS